MKVDSDMQEPASLQRTASADNPICEKARPLSLSYPVSSFSSDSANMDIVRAVAVLSVFFAHLFDLLTETRILTSWHFGQMGVSIFFVHTSMVLMLSLERTKLEGPRLFASFYLRRLFRLYPLSIFCVTVAMVFNASPVAGTISRSWTWMEYLANVTLTTNLLYSDAMVGGLWTLPIEVQMYIVLPSLFLVGKKYHFTVLIAILLFSIPVASLQNALTARLNTLSFAPCFISGVIAWKLSTMVERKIPGWLWPFAFVATWPLFHIAERENQFHFRWLFCIALGLAIPWFREVSSGPVKKTAHFVAKYSYGIYLSHVALMLWCFGNQAFTAFRLPFFVLAVIVVPVAMFHLIENPMIKLGRRIADLLFKAHLDPGEHR